MSDDNDRIRQRAYQIWLEEGRPEGREAVHWDMASELVAIEDAQRSTTLPVRRNPDDPEIAATDAEPAEPAASSTGELPTMTDEGEQAYPPSREAETDLPGPVAAEPAKKPAAKRTGSSRKRKKDQSES